MIDLEWYKSFIAIYETGTLTKAAQKMFMTQPGIGIHLSSLEKAIGKKLFIRKQRKLIPTEYAKELYAQIIEPIERLNKVTRLYKKNTTIPTLRVGAPLEFFTDILIEKLTNVPYRLWFNFDITDTLLHKLEEGMLDIVIATKKSSIKQIECIPFMEERFLLVGHSSLVTPKFSNKPHLVEEWLTQQKWISYDTNLPIIRRFWLQNFKKRPNIQPTFIIPNLHAARKAIEQQLGISILPEYLCKEALANNTIKLLWKEQEPVINTLYLGTRITDHTNQDILSLKKLLWGNEQ